MDGERDRLRRQIRGWLAGGRLPRPGAEMWVGPGSGHACAICADVIHQSQIEYEIPHGNGWLSVHLPCFSLWKAEAASLLAVSPDASEPRRLGGLLFGERHRPCESEADWTARLRDVSRGDRQALHALYRRMHWPVATFMDRVIRDRDTAAELTAGVFHEVWRRPSRHDPSSGSVAGWIMSLARSVTTDRSPRREGGTPGASPAADMLPAWATAAEPDWDYAAPGVFYSVLARDTEHERVSLLVRLAPGAAYPAHTHAGVEELYLLEGQLFIDGRVLSPGDYNRAEAGSGDQHVWSDTGCSCVLLTSTLDILR